MIKVFLDANILLEVLFQRSQHAESAAILKAGEQNKIDLFTSSSVIGFIAYWMIKDWGIQKTKETLLALLTFIRSIDISHEQVLNSLKEDFKDIEDGIQYFTAVEHDQDYFVTLDKKGFRKSKGAVKVVTPMELSKTIGH